MIPRLHVVTDDWVLGRPDVETVALAILEAGGDRVAVHVRGPRSSGRRIYDVTAGLAGPARDAGSWLVVNDRIDVALAAGVPHVHLGARSLPGSVVRGILGSSATIGRSVHSSREMEAEAVAEIDYFFIGPVFDTPSHPGAGAGGKELVVKASVSVSAPVLAIGGLTPERVPAVTDSGAWGVAVIRAVWDAPSAAEAVESILSRL